MIPLDDYRWLLSEEGTRWVNRVTDEQLPLVSQVSRLRRELSADRVHLILEQVELRARGRSKFVDADRMFFTQVALEQSTDQYVAAYKAARYPERKPIADLCCGIGGDLLALAPRGAVIGVDRDPVVALLAEANIRILKTRFLRQPAAEVKVAEVIDFPIDEYTAWHVDPDRRPQRKRTTDPARHQPSTQTINRLLDRQGDAAVKLAPAATVPERWARRAELEWISRDRECRQLVAWFGSLAEHPGRRRATILSRTSHDPTTARSLLCGQFAPVPVASRIGRYVFDPDPAVLAADLLAVPAAEHDLARLAEGVAYLTGDRAISDVALACFEVSEVLPFDLKRLKRLLESRRVGRLEIKKRGVDHRPEEIRQRLGLKGDKEAVLIISPLGKRVMAIVSHRA